MIKVSSLSSSFQSLYKQYKDSTYNKLPFNEKSSFELTNDFILHKNKLLISKMTTEEFLLKNHNKLVKSNVRSPLELYYDNQLSNYTNQGKLLKLQKKVDHMIFAETLPLPLSLYEKIGNNSKESISKLGKDIEHMKIRTKFSGLSIKRKYKNKLNEKKVIIHKESYIDVTPIEDQDKIEEREEREENLENKQKNTDLIGNNDESSELIKRKWSDFNFFKKKDDNLLKIKSNTNNKKKIMNEKNKLLKQKEIFKYEFENDTFNKIEKSNQTGNLIVSPGKVIKSKHISKNSSNEYEKYIINNSKDFYYYSKGLNKYIKGSITNNETSPINNLKLNLKVKTKLPMRTSISKLDLSLSNLGKYYDTAKEQNKHLVKSIISYKEVKKEMKMKINFWKRNFIQKK